MLPFLRRNTTAGVTEPEVVEVQNEEWVDPVEKAVREVGLGTQGEFRIRVGIETITRVRGAVRTEGTVVTGIGEGR